MIARMCPDGNAFVIILEEGKDYLGEFILSKVEKDGDRIILWSGEVMVGIIRPKQLITSHIIWESNAFNLEVAVALVEEVVPGFTDAEFHDCEEADYE